VCKISRVTDAHDSLFGVLRSEKVPKDQENSPKLGREQTGQTEGSQRCMLKGSIGRSCVHVGRYNTLSSAEDLLFIDPSRELL